tara:strand:- start:6067 stop:6246 length:180 start_codon:yes stop_codon:yes gene_type:complete
MRGRVKKKTTTISHPIYGHVEWLDSNVEQNKILVSRYCAKHGEHIQEWIDWTFPTKKES